MNQSLGNQFIEFIYLISDKLQLNDPFRVIMLILDITIVSFIFIYLYKLIKKTRAEQIFKGVLVLILLLFIAKVTNMVILNFILTNFMTYGLLFFIVIFQPELRNAFEKIGRNSKISSVFEMEDNITKRQNISEIIKAVDNMSLNKIGALIVIQKKTKVSEVLKEGVTLNSNISSELLQNIFVPRTSLHDGAVIIEDDKILAARCILPLASESVVDKRLGTRHRAAVGITEISDSVVIVVSEETGIISIAENGLLVRNFNKDSLREYLIKNLEEDNNLSKFKGVKKILNNKKIKKKN